MKIYCDSSKREIRLYVENKSLSQALEILKKNHYVVISGIPGIGKTTLAYILVYTMLAQGFEEFVCITDDMDNAAKMFEKEKRQIFFFDDFLGSNSFVQQSVSFENKLLTFIEKVKNSQNTLFILSTREYVLSEAMTHYEKLAMSNIDLAKCTIQLEHYTKTIKARILYNHLAEANIPAEYINTFLDKHGYRELIEHKNFNPRVIESIIKDQIWDAITPHQFTVKIKEFFDNPISVWQFAFDKLDMATRYALLVLGTMGNKVMLDDFQQAYKTFCSLTRVEIGLTYDDVTWRQLLKVLSNCFIKTEARYGIQLVSMYNPSIADFVVSYLNNNHNTIVRLITGACFIEQLYYVFTDNVEMANSNNQVLVREVDFPMLYDSFNRIWNQWKTCQLKERCWNEVKREGFWETRILYDFITKYPAFCKYYDVFGEKQYDTDELTCGLIEMKYRVGMMELLYWDKQGNKVEDYLSIIVAEESLTVDEWIELAGLINKFGLEKVIMNKYCYNKLDDELHDEIRDLSDLYDCDEYKRKIDKLSELLPNWSWYWTYSTISDVEERLKEEDEQKDTNEADIKYDSWRAQREKEDSQIDEMFSSLRVFS